MSPALAVDALMVVTAVAYAAASALFLRYLVGMGPEGVAPSELPPSAPRLVMLAAAMHGAHIFVASFVWRVCPVEGVHFPVSVASVLMAVAYLAARRRYRVDVAGAFVAPLALASLLASRYVGGGAASSAGSTMQSLVLPVHILMNLVGVALFGLAFATASLYLVEERLLKKKRTKGLLQRLPPLDALDRAEHRFLLAGFPLLTLGIVTGTLWAKAPGAQSSAELLRAVFGYVTWLLVAGVLFLRAAAGWRGRRAAYGTIAGFGCAVLVLLLYLARSLGSGGSV